MYLKQAFIRNSGSIKRLALDLAFTANGRPKPLILVGGNGGGKTNFLSQVADALFEGATIHYTDVLPSQGQERAWFRVVGARTTTMGTGGGCSLLGFDDEGEVRVYREKGGNLDPAVIKAEVQPEFAEHVNWDIEGVVKDIAIDDHRTRVIFAEGAYAYFPSSRSEIPYWLNRSALPETSFDVAPRMSKKLRKPIYIEHAMDQFKQWIIGLLSDSRTEIEPSMVDGKLQWSVVGDASLALISAPGLKFCNELLRAILDRPNARFVWMGRKSSDKVAIWDRGTVVFPNLDALSAGQSILLGVFGTILQYGDLARNDASMSPENIEGICIIGEIDALTHIDLQNKALPAVVKLFPKVQFLLSSHSPIFVVGMEREFSSEGLQIIEMPEGLPVNAETYAEFGKALEALTATHAFTERMVTDMRSGVKPVVYVEGETDAPYLNRAAELLGKNEILDECDIEWIGAKKKKDKTYHTGKDALKATLNSLRAKPDLAVRRVLLLNDNDVKIEDQDYDGLSVRKIPINPRNKKIKAGIENLLREECIDENIFRKKRRRRITAIECPFGLFGKWISVNICVKMVRQKILPHSAKLL